jgi:NAD(P)-dependent dehydrogenase (short-subunit alcohol dehydrogenase family)
MEGIQRLKDRVAVITGGGRGIGRALALGFAAKGARVAVASRTAAQLQETARLVRGRGGEVLAVVADVSDENAVRDLVRQTLAAWGRIDVLINNAGYELAGALEETDIAEAKAQFETNFFGVLRMTNAVLPVMRGQQEGRIINIGSLAGLVAVPFHGMYSASKYALEGYSEALRQEVKPFNISVSLIEPGFSSTNLAQSARQSVRLISDYEPMRERIFPVFVEAVRAGQKPEAIARVILSLITKSSPRLRYRVGSDSQWLPRLKMIATEASFEAGVRKKFHLDG